MSMPAAFTPPDPPPYVPETDDQLLPSKGFVTDFVASLRGVETPSLFCAWSALWALSAASARLVSMKWLPESPLFPNLYVFLVAPPGRCHKSTAASYAMSLLTGMAERFSNGTAQDGFLKYMSDFNWMTSKTTPDVMYELLKPKGTVIAGTDKVLNVKKGSQLTGCVSELATFLNKKKFNVGLVDTLTDLFDSKPKDVIHTLGRGTLELEDIYVTLIGATTPTGMKESLPYEAFGEGFVSRTVIVYREKTPREFPEPVFFEGFPTLKDLRDKLAWIMRNKLGEYDLTEGARDWYHAWYKMWRKSLDSDERYSERVAEFRFDVNLLRVALLIAMSRYDSAMFVEKQDLLDAERLLKGTFASTLKANTDAGIAASEFSSDYMRVADYIQRHKKVDRMKMASAMSSKGIAMAAVKQTIDQLMTEGRIAVTHANGKPKESFEWTKTERYVWVEGSRRENDGSYVLEEA